MPDPILDFFLPLNEDDCFRSSSLQIKIHQGEDRAVDEENASAEAAAAVDAAENMHDTGFVMWPSAVMLSRWITQHPSVVWDCSGDILELGAGCGLVGLTAAALLKQGRSSSDPEEKSTLDTETEATPTPTPSIVIMTDYNPAARDNLHRNAFLNEVVGRTSVAGLDFFDQMPPSYDGGSSNIEGKDDDDDNENTNSSWIDMDGNCQPQVHLVLGADIIAYSNDAEMVANTIQAALLEGGQAIVLGPDANQRFGLEGFEDCCLDVGLTVRQSVIVAGQTTFDGGASNSRDSDEEEKQDLVDELEQTGVVTGNGYNFVMYTIDKPCKTT